MELRCTICGKRVIVTEEHMDYEKIMAGTKMVFICIPCQAKIKHEADEEHKPRKPM